MHLVEHPPADAGRYHRGIAQFLEHAVSQCRRPRTTAGERQHQGVVVGTPALLKLAQGITGFILGDRPGGILHHAVR